MNRPNVFETNSHIIIDYLKRQIQLKPICQQILFQEIISNSANKHGVQVTSDEVQSEADRIRRDLKLEDASQTYRWLEDQLTTCEDWEKGIQLKLLSKKLAEHLFSKKAETYFSQNKAQYEQVILYRIVVPYYPVAQELFYKIEEEEISFFEAAHLYDIDEGRRLSCGFAGKLSRWQLSPDMSSTIFGARPHELIGVNELDNGYELLMVDDFISPELNPTIKQGILDKFFQEWLDSELNYAISTDAVSTDILE